MDGVVAFVGPFNLEDFEKGFGYLIVVRSGEGINLRWRVFGHLEKDSSKLKLGDPVNADTEIGIMGDTGNATKRSLHMEERVIGEGC